MKGIILAGGKGTRLYPMTKIISKQLLPIYDKPMIYYPISTLMLAGIKDILIISTPEDIERFEQLLGDGKQLGMNFSYKTQKEPKGIAEAFIIGEDFIGKDNVCLILGDNIFYGSTLEEKIEKAAKIKKGGVIFGYPVEDPKAFGVVEFDENNNVLSIEEKPKEPKSNYAVPGLYFYDNSVIEKAKKIEASDRGELEITEINNCYLKEKSLSVIQLGRGIAWLDTGTPRGLSQASQFVQIVQERQGFYIACLEEIAYREGFINKEQLLELGKKLKATKYGKYITKIANSEGDN